MQNLQFEWDKEIPACPVVRRNTSTREIKQRVEKRIHRKRGIFNRYSPWFASFCFALVLLGVFVNQFDRIVDFLAGGGNRTADSTPQNIEKVPRTPSKQTAIQSLPDTQTSLSLKAQIGQAYVVMYGHFYVLNGDIVEQTELDIQIGEVKRVGDWQYRQDGDSMFFPPASPLYSIRDINAQEKIAVRVATGTSKMDPQYKYVVLQRGEAVKAADSSTILSAKGDPQEISVALNNVRKKAPFLYEFQNENRLIANLVKYDDAGVTLYYQVPEADTNNVQGFMFVLEYKNGSDNTVAQSNPQKYFDLNGIRWGYYNDRLLRGEKQGHVYEIQTQGKFSYDTLTALLENFKPTGQ